VADHRVAVGALGALYRTDLRACHDTGADESFERLGARFHLSDHALDRAGLS
jgi:hypothetical protein